VSAFHVLPFLPAARRHRCRRCHHGLGQRAGRPPAYIVGVSELSKLATQVNGRSMGYAAEVFAAVALLYFMLCVVIEAGAAAALHRVQGPRRRGAAAARKAVARPASASVRMR
jgi:hypothetical protein